ncbi:hypothetical protein, partial [Mesobacillus zeae]|uniref:hypothetical protein n=1 Tax=Mesobacillus zeae TaxID=1917180 RepID=UPI0015F858A1
RRLVDNAPDLVDIPQKLVDITKKQAASPSESVFNRNGQASRPPPARISAIKTEANLPTAAIFKAIQL